jgi:hypothetical protein
VIIFVFLIAKSKDLAVFVNKPKPMGIGLNALFAIANYCPQFLFHHLFSELYGIRL